MKEHRRKYTVQEHSRKDTVEEHSRKYTWQEHSRKYTERNIAVSIGISIRSRNITVSIRAGTQAYIINSKTLYIYQCKNSTICLTV